MANYAKTTLTEKDLSQVADSQSGVSVALVGAFRRGDINTPRLNARDTQFLRRHTRNGKSVDIKDPEACFHAITSLEQTQELWSVRSAKNALYSVIRILASNFAVTSSNTVIEGVTVDILKDELTLSTNIPIDSTLAYKFTTDNALPAPVLVDTNYFLKQLTTSKVKAYTSLANLNTASISVSLDNATDIVTATAHGLVADEPVYLDSASLPVEITRYKTYYVGYLTANTFNLLDAPSGAIVTFSTDVVCPLYSNFIDFTTAGTGNHSINFSINLDTNKQSFNGSQVSIGSNKMFLDPVFIAKLYTGAKIVFNGVSLPLPLVNTTEFFAVINPLDPTYISIANSLSESLSKSSRFTVNPSSDILTTDITTGYVNGQAVRLSTDNILPSIDVSSVISPLSSTTTYYLIKISDKQFKLASSYVNAIAGTSLDVVGVGLGNHTISPRFIEFTSVGSGTNYVYTRNNSNHLTESNFYVDVTNNRINISSTLGNRLENNSVVKVFTDTTGTYPAPLDGDTKYYVIKISTTIIQLSLIPDGSPIVVTTLGNGDLKIINAPEVVEPSALDQGSDDAVLLYTKNEGAWGSEHYAQFLDNRSSVADSFIINVYHQSNLNLAVESWTVSRKVGAKDTDGNNIFIEDVLDASEIIGAISNPLITDTIFPLCNEKYIRFGGGSDGDTVTDSDMILSLQTAFSNPSLVSVKLFIDAGFNVPSYQRALNALATARGNAVALHGTPITKEKSADYLNQLVDFRRVELALDSSYSALYTPHVQIKDKYNDRKIYISPEVFGANAICFSKRNFQIWYPPAGFTRGKINVEGLLKHFEEGELNILAQAQINAIRFDLANSTNVIWDQQTLSSVFSLLQSLHIRLLVNEIKTLAKPLLDRFLFDLNDTGTRDLAKGKIDDIGAELKRTRGLFAFRTVADSSNNTNQVISQKRLVVDFYITPIPEVREINFTVVLLNPGFDIALAQALN